MQFSLSKAVEILARTPQVLTAMLDNLSSEWINANEGDNSWSPKEIVAHLIINEKTNWIPRAKIILSETGAQTFEPIDMTGHFHLSENYSLGDLLNEFAKLREISIHELEALHINETRFKKTAIHPRLGIITLEQLIATWLTHDLSHTAQITRVLARQQKNSVGPFATFLPILNSSHKL